MKESSPNYGNAAAAVVVATKSRSIVIRQSRILLLAVIFTIFILNIWNITGKIAATFQSPDAGFGPPSVSQSKNNGKNTAGVKICPGAWDFYPNNDAKRTFLIDQLYWRAHDYHNTGGNLEAMEKFLNRALDYTYETRGFTPFVFNDNSTDAAKGRKEEHSSLSISEEIKAQLRRDDVGNRGGYTQRNLPGKFTGPGAANKLDDVNGHMTNVGRMTNVLEPVSQERWDIAIGPTLPQDSCMGYHVLQGQSGRRYEDKFICGWEHGPYSTREKRHLRGDYFTKQKGGCHIVSIGSNDQWGFEEAIVAGTDCSVATFDCTITHPRHKPKTDRVQFYSQCISATEENYQTDGIRNYTGYFDMLDLAGFVNNNNDTNSANKVDDTSSTTSRINYMKIDVEGYEYGVLTNMIRQARKRNLWHLLPDQIQIEFHYATWMYDLGWTLRTRDVGELATFFSMLFREAGYMAVHVDVNRWPSIREVLFLRIYC